MKKTHMLNLCMHPQRQWRQKWWKKSVLKKKKKGEEVGCVVLLRLRLVEEFF